MQKTTKKASILIWAIFLSLILSISFLSISTKITKNLRNSNSLEKNISESIKIQNKINSIKKDFSQITKDIEINTQNKTLQKTLKKYEKFTINFPESSTGSLELTSSGIIYYDFGGITGFLDNTNTKYEFGNQNGNLKLENYSGLSSFKLTSNKKFDFDGKKYKIIETIGNKKIIKQSGTLK